MFLRECWDPGPALDGSSAACQLSHIQNSYFSSTNLSEVYSAGILLAVTARSIALRAIFAFVRICGSRRL